MASTKVFINDIHSVVPETEVHEMFLNEGPKYLGDDRKRKLFARLASKGQIERRYSVLPMNETEVGPGLLEFYKKDQFPTTEERMKRYKAHALPLVKKALQPFSEKKQLEGVTHVIVTSCTGFYAPGIDTEIVREFGLSSDTERTIIGFMGCYAAFNGMKQANQIVKSQSEAKVLMVNVELCTLHFQQSTELEPMLGFLIFADGCSASLISAEAQGLELKSFKNFLCSENVDKITWEVGDQGFNMFLSTDVPKSIGQLLPEKRRQILDGQDATAVNMWAIHPGGRSILDAIQAKLELSDEKMEPSRQVLRDYGNMSSPSVMFVLEKHLKNVQSSGDGCAMAFGPGLTIESMKFHKSRL